MKTLKAAYGSLGLIGFLAIAMPIWGALFEGKTQKDTFVDRGTLTQANAIETGGDLSDSLIATLHPSESQGDGNIAASYICRRALSTASVGQECTVWQKPDGTTYVK